MNSYWTKPTFYNEVWGPPTVQTITHGSINQDNDSTLYTHLPRSRKEIDRYRLQGMKGIDITQEFQANTHNTHKRDTHTTTGFKKNLPGHKYTGPIP
jgi:hypothetical protein